MHIEFFESRPGIEIDGSRELLKLNGEYMTYDEFESDYNKVRILLHFLNDFPECREILLKMSVDGIMDPRERLRQFKRCNLDALDKTIDIDTDKGYFNPEYVNKCGSKGANRHCPHARQEGDMKPYCLIKNKYQIPQK